MFTTAGPTSLAILTKSLGGVGVGDDLEWSCVAAVALIFLAVDSVSGERSGEDGG